MRFTRTPLATPIRRVFICCLSLYVATACSSSTGPGGSGGGSAESWSIQLTGTTVGAFVCFFGTDAYYTENATLTFSVASALAHALAISSQTSTTTTGVFSNTETAHESSGGVGCAPAPSVHNSSVSNLPVTITIVAGQIQVSSNATLIVAPFIYGPGSVDSLNTKKLLITPTPMASGASTDTGSFFADPGTGNRAAQLTGGAAVLTRTS